MSFHEVRLPTDVERGAAGGPGFMTSIAFLNSGREQRNALWTLDRGRWDVAYGIQTRADALAVRNFFVARRGRAYGFRFRDWANYQTEGTPMPAGEEADGTITEFQLRYVYDDGNGFTYEKTIYKPVLDGFKVYVDDVLQASGWTLDTTTGIISFTSPPAYGSDVSWEGKFDLPVRFDTDQLEAVVTTREIVSFPSLPIIELKQ